MHIETLRQRGTQVKDVQRQYLYFNSGAEVLFGWLHKTTNGESSDVAAVICNPLGVEYMSGHRSIRRLADSLANSGIQTLRFDYSCTGDSSGGEFKNTSVSQITGDIRSAIDTARSATGASRIALIGIGLGATFAALATHDADIGPLILWNPTARGRRFVREQKLLADILDESGNKESEAIDSAGIYLTAEMQQQIGQVDLTQLQWTRASPVLLVSRSDMDSNRKLVEVLSEKDFQFEHETLPGYKEMMDQPTNTIVPVAAFDFICGWIGATSVAGADRQPIAEISDASFPSPRASIQKDDITAIELEEIPAYFGESGQLFGIATKPGTKGQELAAKTAYVFLNCGSEHHAGPHRLYTILCRRMASHGAFAFRFDIEGIGDSVSIGRNDENNSYSPVAVDDIDQALRYLTQEYGCDAFVVSGICAGAYHSFKAAVELEQHNILEANLINPLVYEWNYDDPDDHLKYEVHTYKSAIRDRNSWRRLLSGDIDYRRLLRSVLRLLTENVRRLIERVSQAFVRRTPKGLPSDLRTLHRLERPLTLILSEGDPGLDIMKLQARRETRVGLADGNISVHELAKSNHGLSKKTMQDQLVARLENKYFGNGDDSEISAASGQ